MQEKRNSKDSNNQDLQSDSLRHVQAFNDEGLSYGIPTTIFWGGVVLSLTFSFLLKWYIGIVFAFVYFLAMYEIHKDDPKALQAWLDAAISRRTDVWVTEVSKKRKIHIIDKE